jgi:hypothetical protein
VSLVRLISSWVVVLHVRHCLIVQLISSNLDARADWSRPLCLRCSYDSTIICVCISFPCVSWGSKAKFSCQYSLSLAQELPQIKFPVQWVVSLLSLIYFIECYFLHNFYFLNIFEKENVSFDCSLASSNLSSADFTVITEQREVVNIDQWPTLFTEKFKSFICVLKISLRLQRLTWIVNLARWRRFFTWANKTLKRNTKRKSSKWK